ncbi:hypothetical protein NDI76_06620 [Halogeometricum sp. S1BR25-6]|uniref:CARDB domain-containing protein n=1 Tax=Halogeometricum salsisoli TaxID=2950536 RepID=A0ABU2GCD9_9EURY|nr:hypothetical protein [Halogeometricum sp. S1BR25-6]MDS0298409.1 hypothetical protein [Halogeometricum sp. S1BR25-6]
MSRAAVLALLVVLSSVAGIGLVDAQTTTAFISNATVSPEQPAPGEQFTVRTTVQNSQQSGGGFEITDVYVRQRGSTDDVARVEDIGTLPPGSDVTVPLTASFDSTGTRELRVYVVGRNPSDEVVRLQYPVVVTVREGGPQVGVSVEDAVVGTEGTVQVTAANGEDTAVRNLRVSLSGDAGIRDDTRVLATLPGNESRTFNFSVTPRSQTTDLAARVQYTTTSGSTRTVAESVTLDADPLRESVQLDASVVGDGADPDVAVDVANLGNAPLEDAVVELARDGNVLFRRPVADVAPDETRTTRVNVSNVETGPMDVRVRYETGGRTGEATTRLNYSANPGRIELTGLDYETEEGKLHVSGTASNVGLGDVDSVVVRVVRTENVTPARPNPEYFVGSIPASDFSSFDLYAEVDPGTETVPIEVTYLANGAERTTRTELDVSDLNAQPAEEGDSGGLPTLPLVVLAALALLVIVGVAGYAYFRR